MNRTTIEQWAVLAAVVDEGGFAQAATALNRSQSAVSYAVARLQEAVDVPLLAIEGRKAVLTAHGQEAEPSGRTPNSSVAPPAATAAPVLTSSKIRIAPADRVSSRTRSR